MDKVQKIREEVERIINRRLNLLNGDYFDLREETNGFTNEIMDIIDSMQEEPVSEDLEEIAWNHADKKCHLDIAVFTPDEVKKERGKMQFTWQDLYDAVVFGAEWKEKQMMVKAVDAHVCYAWSSLCFGGFDWSKTGLDIGDKCKLIIIKED